MKQYNYLLISISMLLCFASCKTLEQRCNERFPVQTETIVKTVTLTDTLILPDTFIEFIDTTVCPPSEEPKTIIKTIVKEIPGQTIYHETECIDTVVVVKDHARYEYYKNQYSYLKGKLTSEKSASKSTQMWVYILISVVTILSGLLVRQWIR